MNYSERFMIAALLLFFVFVGELGLAAVVYLAADITPKHALGVFFLVYFLQFITSTIQGSISDNSLRRVSLIIAFYAVLLGQLFFLLAFENPHWLWGAILLYGFIGNITPIARAALADTELRDNFRLSVGLSTIAIALGWVIMAFAAYYMPSFLGCILVTILCLACSFLVRFIKDPKDRPHRETFSLRHQFGIIASLFKHPEVYWGLSGYFVAEIAFYQIFARGKGQVYDPHVRFIITTWVVGYVLGAVLQHFIFRKRKERSGIFWGACVSIVAMLCLIVLTTHGIENTVLLILTNVSFAFGFGLFIPCLFSIVSQRYQSHMQGKIYGLIDAVDSLALMLAVGINHVPIAFNLASVMEVSLLLTGIALVMFFLTMKHAK